MPTGKQADEGSKADGQVDPHFIRSSQAAYINKQHWHTHQRF